LSSRHDSAFLKDIAVAAHKVGGIVAGLAEESFFADEVRQAAVLHHLTVIGEAVNRLSPEIKDRYPDMPGHQIISVRHRIVHAYFDLEWKILWVAATDDTPWLPERVETILRTDFPEL
jgi:uncharacterized protein with HEPN domain